MDVFSDIPDKDLHGWMDSDCADEILSLRKQRDEYRDTIAQQAELLAAHKSEMQDWQRQLLAAQQERDEYKNDADRYRWLRERTKATNASCFSLPAIIGIPSANLMRGSVAQHLDAAIAAAPKEMK